MHLPATPNNQKSVQMWPEDLREAGLGHVKPGSPRAAASRLGKMKSFWSVTQGAHMDMVCPGQTSLKIKSYFSHLHVVGCYIHDLSELVVSYLCYKNSHGTNSILNSTDGYWGFEHSQKHATVGSASG